MAMVAECKVPFLIEAMNSNFIQMLIFPVHISPVFPLTMNRLQRFDLYRIVYVGVYMYVYYVKYYSILKMCDNTH